MPSSGAERPKRRKAERLKEISCFIRKSSSLIIKNIMSISYNFYALYCFILDVSCFFCLKTVVNPYPAPIFAVEISTASAGHVGYVALVRQHSDPQRPQLRAVLVALKRLGGGSGG